MFSTISYAILAYSRVSDGTYTNYYITMKIVALVETIQYRVLTEVTQG